MATLFGIDIASIVRGATKGQLFVGTLVRKTKTGLKNYVFEGSPGDSDEAINVQARSSTSRSTIIIIALSITPHTVPRNQDIIKFNNLEYTILSIDTDGAEATHTCRVALK